MVWENWWFCLKLKDQWNECIKYVRIWRFDPMWSVAWVSCLSENYKMNVHVIYFHFIFKQCHICININLLITSIYLPLFWINFIINHTQTIKLVETWKLHENYGTLSFLIMNLLQILSMFIWWWNMKAKWTNYNKNSRDFSWNTKMNFKMPATL